MSVHIVEARATQQMPARRRAPQGCGPQAPGMIPFARRKVTAAVLLGRVRTGPAG